MLNRRHLLATLPGLALIAPARANDPITVVTTTSIHADLVSVVGGDRVAVTSLVGRNQDSHGFEVLPTHVRAVGQARLLVSNGAGLEPWLARLVAASGHRGSSVTLATGITLRKSADDPGHNHGHSHGANDPHIWQDPRRVQQMVRSLANTLAAVEPASAATFQAAAERYTRELQALEGWVGEQLRPIPPARRRAIVSHNSFGYYGERFGVEFRSPRATPGAEPTAQQVAALIRQIRDQRVTAIFLENIADARVLERIAREAGAKLGGRLYSDALSDVGGNAPTYLEMIRANTATLVAGFAG